MEALPLQAGTALIPFPSISLCSISKGPKQREGIPPFQPTCEEKVAKVLQGITDQEMCLSCAVRAQGPLLPVMSPSVHFSSVLFPVRALPLWHD